MNHLSTLLALTFRQPRAAARYLVSLELPAGAIWSALFLMAVGSALLLHLDITLGLVERPQEPVLELVFGTPFATAGVQLAMMCLLVFIAHFVGRMFGGEATVEEVALAVAWVQFVLLVLQVAQMLAYLVLPPLAGVIVLAAAFLSFYLLSTFLAEVHRFRSAALVFVGILISAFVAAFLLSLVLVSILPREAFNV